VDLISELMRKCGAITKADIEAIGDELAKLAPADFHEQAPWIEEGLWLILADCLYEGDAKLKDLSKIMDRAEVALIA
jgi:hypothetical protein